MISTLPSQIGTATSAHALERSPIDPGDPVGVLLDQVRVSFDRVDRLPEACGPDGRARRDRPLGVVQRRPDP